MGVIQCHSRTENTLELIPCEKTHLVNHNTACQIHTNPQAVTAFHPLILTSIHSTEQLGQRAAIRPRHLAIKFLELLSIFFYEAWGSFLIKIVRLIIIGIVRIMESF